MDLGEQGQIENHQPTMMFRGLPLPGLLIWEHSLQQNHETLWIFLSPPACASLSPLSALIATVGTRNAIITLGSIVVFLPA